MKILGVNAYKDDSTVVYIKDDKIIKAAYEKHFSRKEHDSSFPSLALRWVLDAHSDIDYIAYADEKTFKQFSKEIKRFSRAKPVLIESNDALALAAALPYNLDTSAVIVINSAENKHCVSLGYYNGLGVTWLKHISEASIFDLYSAVSKLLGINNKLTMLYARDGVPSWKQWAYDNIITSDNANINIKVDTTKGFGTAFLDVNIASTAQTILEEILADLANWLHMHISTDNLVLGGYLSDNTDLISSLYKNTNYTTIATPLDSTMAHSSLGAAASMNKPLWETAYLGFESSDNVTPDDKADFILTGALVGVINGRTEFSAESLGNRSYICVPSKENIAKLRNIHNKDYNDSYSVVCQEKESNSFFKLLGDSKYKNYTVDVLQSNYKTKHNKLCVQTINMTANAYLNRILEKTRQYGFPFLLCADLKLNGMPLVNRIEDYENEIQLYH